VPIKCPHAQAARRRVAWGLLIGVGLRPLGGCASVPNVEAVIDRSADADAKPHFVGASGPLSVAQSKMILDKLRAQAPDSDVLQRHLAIEEGVVERPLAVGNRTRILRDGTQTFNAMIAAIHGARDHINLEYYIVEDIESGGDVYYAFRPLNVGIVNGRCGERLCGPSQTLDRRAHPCVDHPNSLQGIRKTRQNRASGIIISEDG